MNRIDLQDDTAMQTKAQSVPRPATTQVSVAPALPTVDDRAGCAEPGGAVTNVPSPLALGFGLDVRTTLFVLLRHARFLAGMTVVAMLVAIAVSTLSSPEYTAKVSLLPAAPADGLGAIGMGQFTGFASSLGLGGPASGVAVAYPDIIRSRQVCERVLAQEFSTVRAGKVNLETYLANPRARGTMRTAEALKELSERVRVSVDKLSGVLQITVTMPESKLSAQVAGAFVAELLQVESGLHQETARRNRQFIEQRLTETTQALQQAEGQLTTFREHNLRVGNDPELQLQGERLLREVEIQKQVYLTLTQQYELAKIEETRRGAGVQVIDPAREPFAKSSPILLKNLVLGTFFGFAGAGLLVLAHSWWRTVRGTAALPRV